MGRAASHLRRTLQFLVPAGAVIYLGVCALLYTKQRSLLYFPTPAGVNGEANTVRLPMADAKVLVSVRERPGPDALIYFGGNAEDVRQNLPMFSAAFPKHAIYLLHYRGYGGSGGQASETALAKDALALFDLARARHKRIVVVGRSLGSGLAVRVASLRPASRLVLVTPYDSIVDIAAGLYPVLPVRWLINERYESWRYAPKVSAPTLIIEAGQDDVIPNWSTERLLTRFRKGIATMKVLPGATHNNVWEKVDFLPLFVDAGKH